MGGCLASAYVPDIYKGAKAENGFSCPTCVSHKTNSGAYDFTEAFANLGENWVLDGLNVDANRGFNSNELGGDMRDWMDEHMEESLRNMGVLPHEE